MSPSEFFSALVDDITGKDANGRNAQQKKDLQLAKKQLNLDGLK